MITRWFLKPPRMRPGGRCERGQVTVLTAILVGILATTLILTTDVTMAVARRLATQNAADAAAISIATWEARGLNTITYLNYAVGVALFIYIVTAISTGGASLWPFPPPYLKPIWTMQDMVRAYITVPAVPHAWTLAQANHVQFGLAMADSRPRRVPIYGLGSWFSPMPLHAERRGLIQALWQFLGRLGLRLPPLPRWLRRFLDSLRIGLFYYKTDGPNERGWGLSMDATATNRLQRFRGPTPPAGRLSLSGSLGRFFMRGIGQSVCYSRTYRNRSGSFLLFVPNWEAELEKLSHARFWRAVGGYGGGVADLLGRAGIRVPATISWLVSQLFGGLMGAETAKVRH